MTDPWNSDLSKELQRITEPYIPKNNEEEKEMAVSKKKIEELFGKDKMYSAEPSELVKQMKKNRKKLPNGLLNKDMLYPESDLAKALTQRWKDYWANPYPVGSEAYYESKQPKKGGKLKNESKWVRCSKCGADIIGLEVEEYYKYPMRDPICGACIKEELDRTSGRGEGTKHDKGKIAHHLVPWDAFNEAVKVLMFGEEVYGADNWKSVPNLRIRYIDAMIRHATKALTVKNDEETGLSHMAHSICCALFVLWEELNDRRTTELHG